MPNYGYATLSVIPSLQGGAAALTGQMSGPAQAAGLQAGGVFGGGFASALTVGGGIAAAGAAIVGGLAAVGATFDEAFDTIRIGTGATGAELAGLEDSFKSVVTSVPTDFGIAANAITGLNQRLHLTGAPLENVSRRLLELSRITETDIGQNVDTVTRAFGDWGISTRQMGGTLDQFFRASQLSGTSVADLAQNVTNFGSPLRQLGFSLQDSLAMFSRFEAEGVNTSTVMSGMRQAVKNLGNGFATEQTGVRTFQDIIRGVRDGTFDLTDAMTVFGARAGTDVFKAIEEGRFRLGRFRDEIAGGSDTILGAAGDTNDWRESLELLKNRALVLLEPVATRVFNGISAALDGVTRAVTVFQAGGLDGLVNMFGGAESGVGQFVAAVRSGVQTVQGLWRRFGDEITGAVQGFVRLITQSFRSGFQFWKGIWDVFAGIFTGDWSRVWQGLRRVVTAVLRQIGNIFRNGGAVIVNIGRIAMQLLGQAISGALGGIVGWFRALPGRIVSGLASLAGRLGTAGRTGLRGLWDGAQAVWGNVIDWVRGLPDRIVTGLGSLGRLLYDAGRAIMEGLKEGIEDALGGVLDVVSGIGDRIASLKGPLPKDRRLLIPAGLAIMAGLEEGLRTGWAGPERFLRGVAPSMDGTFAVAGAAGPGRVPGSAGGARVVIDFTGLSDDLVRHLRKRIRTEGGNVQTVLGS